MPSQSPYKAPIGFLPQVESICHKIEGVITKKHVRKITTAEVWLNAFHVKKFKYVRTWTPLQMWNGRVQAINLWAYCIFPLNDAAASSSSSSLILFKDGIRIKIRPRKENMWLTRISPRGWDIYRNRVRQNVNFQSKRPWGNVCKSWM